MRLALWAAGACSWAATALAQPPLPEAWLEAQRDERGLACQAHDQVVRAERVLVACGAAGVWEVDISQTEPRLARSYDVGDAVGLLTETDGAVWVKVRAIEARPLLGPVPGTREPLAPLTPSTAPSAPPPAAPAAEPARTTPVAPPIVPKQAGRVIRSQPGQVLISLGAADGLMRSDRVELSVVGASDGEWDSEFAPDVLAVGVVTSLSPTSARVRLGFNEHVPEGARAVRTRSAVTAGVVAPPRAAGLWELELMARPFAALGELGGGLLLSGSFGYRFASNWRLRLLADPIAVADVDRHDAIGVANGMLLGSYDSHYLEMGLGLGAQTVNEAGFALEPGSGLNFSQLIRLGAYDGLNITLRTSVVLFHSEFDFGGWRSPAKSPFAAATGCS